MMGLLRSKAAGFCRFAYNKQTKEFFGRTCKSWGKQCSFLFIAAAVKLIHAFKTLPAQIVSFFLVFYAIVGGIFAVHLAIFIGITPQSAEDVHPWNFGRYAYPNYPNSKIGT